MHASIRELRTSTKGILSAVARGNKVIITYRGKPCAQICPLSEKPTKKLKEDPVFGMWKSHNVVADVDAYVRKLRKGRFS